MKSAKQFEIKIESSLRTVSIIGNGTSFSFELGYFTNPMSFRQSSSFIVSTYTKASSGTNTYYVNKESQALSI